MTEQQPYDVVQQYPGFELRRYPDHFVAETQVSASFEMAGNVAFGRLVRFIGGQNRSSRKLAMTAPVVQHQDQGMPGFVVAFVLPAALDEQAVPEPLDPGVQVRRVPAHTAAAVRFSGRWTRSSVQQHTDDLLAAIARAGLQAAGPPRFARFNPPITPWFLRHNEVVVPVAA